MLPSVDHRIQVVEPVVSSDAALRRLAAEKDSGLALCGRFLSTRDSLHSVVIELQASCTVNRFTADELSFQIR